MLVLCNRYVLRRAAALAVAVFLLCLISTHAMAESYITAGGGAFLPDKDFADAWQDRGTDVGLSYLILNEYSGLEFGMHGYSIDTAMPYDDDLTALGLEALVHFQKQNATFQPFIALGVNVFRTSMTSSLGDEREYGKGFIIKAGVRVFIGKSLFIGVAAKRFKNNADISGFPVNAGGDAVIFEMGVGGF